MFLAALVLSTQIAAAPVTGDFDGDGRRDRASLVASADGGARLMVERGAGGAPVEAASFKPSELNGLYLQTVEPGVLKTACGKGAGVDPCATPRLVLSRQALAYGTREASMFVAHWTGEGFETVAIAD